MMRLNKYIATCGVCSRRRADELIQEREVVINGETITDLGRQVDEEKDKVYVYGKHISLEKKKVYIMLNKPKGYVTTNSDEFDRKSTASLVDETLRVYPIGRLDMYTEGLLIMTNDGEFANKLMHPKNKISKKYLVTVDKKVDSKTIETLRNGVDIGDYVTRPAEVKLVSATQLEITIAEGKNRQVRRMCETLEIKVVDLKRTQVGRLKLGDLKLGTYRYLTAEEIKNI